LFNPGDVLFTQINLKPSPGIIVIEAKVVWLADKQIQSRDYPGMGLEFFSITSQQQELIIKFVESYFTHFMP
tara:strand:- start:466 stop:681 length:216 start_codon:yes stop_codon:yes gene_type:complete